MQQNIKSAWLFIQTLALSIFSDQGRSIVLFLLAVISGLVTIVYTCLNIYFKFIKPNLKTDKNED